MIFILCISWLFLCINFLDSVLTQTSTIRVSEVYMTVIANLHQGMAEILESSFIFSTIMRRQLRREFQDEPENGEVLDISQLDHTLRSVFGNANMADHLESETLYDETKIVNAIMPPSVSPWNSYISLSSLPDALVLPFGETGQLTIGNDTPGKEHSTHRKYPTFVNDPRVRIRSETDHLDKNDETLDDFCSTPIVCIAVLEISSDDEVYVQQVEEEWTDCVREMNIRKTQSKDDSIAEPRVSKSWMWFSKKLRASEEHSELSSDEESEHPDRSLQERFQSTEFDDLLSKVSGDSDDHQVTQTKLYDDDKPDFVFSPYAKSFTPSTYVSYFTELDFEEQIEAGSNDLQHGAEQTLKLVIHDSLGIDLEKTKDSSNINHSSNRNTRIRTLSESMNAIDEEINAENKYIGKHFGYASESSTPDCVPADPKEMIETERVKSSTPLSNDGSSSPGSQHTHYNYNRHVEKSDTPMSEKKPQTTSPRLQKLRMEQAAAQAPQYYHSTHQPSIEPVPAAASCCCCRALQSSALRMNQPVPPATNLLYPTVHQTMPMNAGYVAPSLHSRTGIAYPGMVYTPSSADGMPPGVSTYTAPSKVIRNAAGSLVHITKSPMTPYPFAGTSCSVDCPSNVLSAPGTGPYHAGHPQLPRTQHNLSVAQTSILTPISQSMNMSSMLLGRGMQGNAANCGYITGPPLVAQPTRVHSNMYVSHADSVRVAQLAHQLALRNGENNATAAAAFNCSSHVVASSKQHKPKLMIPPMQHPLTHSLPTVPTSHSETMVGVQSENTDKIRHEEHPQLLPSQQVTMDPKTFVLYPPGTCPTQPVLSSKVVNASTSLITLPTAYGYGILMPTFEATNQPTKCIHWKFYGCCPYGSRCIYTHTF